MMKSKHKVGALRFYKDQTCQFHTLRTFTRIPFGAVDIEKTLVTIKNMEGP